MATARAGAPVEWGGGRIITGDGEIPAGTPAKRLGRMNEELCSAPQFAELSNGLVPVRVKTACLRP
ncbi:MAG: hypothetical protein M3Q96_06485, partial [Pseudomonadota bacterium]|nr:hypothetical protein [Pseudomonadota bacterium]